MGEMPDIGWMELFTADGATGRVPSIRLEDAQVYFEVGDRVGFFTSPTHRLTGVIEQLNPKRARVRCGEDTWAVPYAGLEHLCASTRKARGRRARRLMAVAGEARELMDRHGLADWTLHFNGARTKLGECRDRQKLILLSRSHAVDDPPARITDTILHEIAHALAGPDAAHGPAWKAVARRLGATPASCAPESEEARRRHSAARANFRGGQTVSFVARATCTRARSCE
ncbi:MAG: SprT-like domain-containing protein [Rhodospirillaceae bacterium]|nr:SprT-like domain-containing protein [Rhodospirillaceae bacterium]